MRSGDAGKTLDITKLAPLRENTLRCVKLLALLCFAVLLAKNSSGAGLTN
jgi:hypothetical protein